MNKAVKAKGYTIAVDMWSTGCVTAALLTGYSPFSSSSLCESGSIAEEMFLQTAAECDLHRLDNDKEWQLVGDPPKDFVRGLLTLDEVERMTAAEALSHKWFSNPHHKETFDALYKKAIGVWKPTLQPTNLIKIIGRETKNSKFFAFAVDEMYMMSIPRLTVLRNLQKCASPPNCSTPLSPTIAHAIRTCSACSIRREKRKESCQPSMRIRIARNMRRSHRRLKLFAPKVAQKLGLELVRTLEKSCQSSRSLR